MTDIPQRLPLSVAIVTLNEEENLPRCLAGLGDLAEEIVIVDSGSTDKTESIARGVGARFVSVKWEGFSAQKNRALDLCTRQWILFLDADEVVSPGLAASIRQALASPAGHDAFWLNRRTWYLGAWIWHSWYPEWRLRLLRRGSGRWGGLDPHAALQVTGKTSRLDGDLLHYSFRDLQDHLLRTVRYARTMAESYFKEGRKFRWRHLLLSPCVAFFKHFVLKSGWRDGWRGVVIAGVKAFDCFSKYAFLLERERAPEIKTPRNG